MPQDPEDTVRSLAELAGLPLASERIAATALALPLVVATVQALSALDYGEAEPAGQFRPPRERER